MKEIESYIKKHGHLFDEEPALGHLGRFEDRLGARAKQKRKSLGYKTLQIAAVSVLLLMSSLYVNEHFFSSDVTYVNQELQEAEFYYKTQISYGINTLQKIDGVINEEQRAMLIDEMSEADTLILELQEQLNLTPDDPRLVEAMLNHYRLKSEVITKIVSDLQRIKNNNKIYCDEKQI